MLWYPRERQPGPEEDYETVKPYDPHELRGPVLPTIGSTKHQAVMAKSHPERALKAAETRRLSGG